MGIHSLRLFSLHEKENSTFEAGNTDTLRFATIKLSNIVFIIFVASF